MTATGTVCALHLTDREGAPMNGVPSLRLVKGIGAADDRLGLEASARGAEVEPAKQVTLIEREACMAAAAELGAAFDACASRRNIETEGGDLNALVGRTYRVGANVVLRGVEPCDPCGHLQKMTGLPGLVAALAGRGGLRAEVVTGGTVHAGDVIDPRGE